MQSSLWILYFSFEMIQKNISSPTIGYGSKSIINTTLQIQQWGKRFVPYAEEQTNQYFNGENLICPNSFIMNNTFFLLKNYKNKNLL